ncbi:hypothetical protein GCM10012283_22150 [Phycicoccus endophyticus]|nr:hypothetical protein GCM10012283_22150 [Phycicoccus endophyticus]
MHDAGWTGVSIAATGDGIAVDSLPTNQRSSFQNAVRECESKAGPQPNAKPLTEERVKSQYVALVKSKACLERLGYSISDPPSEEKFVDDYLGGREPWSPFNDVADLSASKWDEVNRTCPQPG